jgi:4-hydroxy-2-oxoheptanedioate aldolase
MFGMGVFSASPAIVEILGYSGFDFVFLDSEHTPLAIDSKLEHIACAADAAGISVVIRLKGNDEHMIRNALELGVDAVCIPHVVTRRDAEHAVRAAKFPPHGIRGASAETRAARYGAGDFNWARYVAEANRDTIVIGLAEDKEFFDNIAEILSVDGLDMINFGPSDLAMSLGHAELYAMDAPGVRPAFERLMQEARARGKAVMCPAAPPTLATAEALVAAGVTAITLRNDLVNFRTLCREFMDRIARPIQGRSPPS